MAEVTSDLEELQYRWQQIETSCRLELGVCTSFLCNESTDSPINTTRLGQPVKAASGFETAGTTSRESLSYHRVYTYPSLLSAEENPPPYQTLGKSYERHSSDPSGRTSERPLADELEFNGDHVNGRYTESLDGTDDWNGSEFERNTDSEYTLSQQDITDVHAAGEQLSKITKKNSSKNGSLWDGKSKSHSFSSSENKSAGFKKKWWSRGKKHHSEDRNNETNSIQLSKSKGSMPILSQR